MKGLKRGRRGFHCEDFISRTYLLAPMVVIAAAVVVVVVVVVIVVVAAVLSSYCM